MVKNHKDEDINQELYERLCAIDARLREHDENFIGFGNLYVEMSYKLNTIIKQTSEIPTMRADIAYLKSEVAYARNDIGVINDKLIQMEAKDDYLLSRIEKIDERIDKISARAYA